MPRTITASPPAADRARRLPRACELRVVELQLEPDAARGLLLDQLEQVDRLPERPGHVPNVVVRVRALERGERAGIGPALEKAAAVPGLDGRSTARACRRHQLDEPLLHRPVETLDRPEDLAAAKQPRRPDRTTPEGARRARSAHVARARPCSAGQAPPGRARRPRRRRDRRVCSRFGRGARPPRARSRSRHAARARRPRRATRAPGSSAFAYAPGQRPRLWHGTRAEQIAQELARHERAVDRQHETHPRATPRAVRRSARRPARARRTVVENRERQRDPVRLLADGHHLLARLPEHAPATLRERLAAEDVASAFGEPNRSDAPPTRRMPVAARRSATAPCTPSSAPRASSRRA